MDKFIITTTINRPTKATLKFCEIAEEKNFKFVVIGDLNTPHQDYHNLEKKFDNFEYLHPEKQERLFPDLSQIIGWKTIQRRNIGFVYSHNKGAEIIATVDDDNIPYDSWGDEIWINKEIIVDFYKNNSCNYFDPLSPTNCNNLWHRGYPIECIKVKNNIDYLGKIKIKPLVQAELWDGDPDIDAICRLPMKPIVKFDKIDAYTSDQIMPFNSQNTFLHKSVLKSYSVFPYVGRMDDIWGAYMLQKNFKNSIVFKKASVYQERNEQDLIKNLENEIIGYRNNFNLLNDLDNINKFLPDNTLKYFEIYQSYFT